MPFRFLPLYEKRLALDTSEFKMLNKNSFHLYNTKMGKILDIFKKFFEKNRFSMKQTKTL